MGILACAYSDNPNYAYSGALLGYLHLSNALYDADRDRWREISGTLCDGAMADFAQNNAYWEH